MDLGILARINKEAGPLPKDPYEYQKGFVIGTPGSLPPKNGIEIYKVNAFSGPCRTDKVPMDFEINR